MLKMNGLLGPAIEAPDLVMKCSLLSLLQAEQEYTRERNEAMGYMKHLESLSELTADQTQALVDYQKKYARFDEKLNELLPGLRAKLKSYLTE